MTESLGTNFLLATSSLAKTNSPFLFDESRGFPCFRWKEAGHPLAEGEGARRGQRLYKVGLQFLPDERTTPLNVINEGEIPATFEMGREELPQEKIKYIHVLSTRVLFRRGDLVKECISRTFQVMRKATK